MSDALHPVVGDLAETLAPFSEQEFHFPDDVVEAFRARIAGHELDDEREEIGLHLGVLAARFMREAKAETDHAVSQLCLLLLELFGSEEAVGDVLERAGATRDRATALVGGAKTDYAALAERSKAGGNAGKLPAALLTSRYRR